jgi:4-amino-4-deoxy-L-arabinose transferase
MNDLVLDIAMLLCLLGGVALTIFFTIKRQISKGLVVVLILAGILRVYLSSDQELHSWDERYHALVAKNLTKHPLKPTLYDNAVYPTNELDWSSSHMWFSKPPVPLWIMASSIAVFGNNVYAVRLPSILLSLVAIYITFLLGRKLFNERVGLSSDHVENCFILCVELAAYFIIMSVDSKKAMRYVVLAGVSAGLAFLSKWFPALIIFPLWLVALLASNSFSWKNFFLQGGVLTITTIVVAMPWVIYLNALGDNILERVLFAFSEPIQDHQEATFYYWHQLMIIFGEMIYIPILFAFYFIKNKLGKKENSILLAWILVPLVVFTIGETKRYTYLMIAAPAVFLLLSNYTIYLIDQYQKSRNKWVHIVLLIGLIGLPIRYSIERLKLFHTRPIVSEFYSTLSQNKDSFTKKDVVFGVEENIELMFFSDVAAVYKFKPNDAQLNQVLDQGYSVYLFEEGDYHQINPQDR